MKRITAQEEQMGKDGGLIHYSGHRATKTEVISRNEMKMVAGKLGINRRIKPDQKIQPARIHVVSNRGIECIVGMLEPKRRNG